MQHNIYSKSFKIPSMNTLLIVSHNSEQLSLKYDAGCVLNIFARSDIPRSFRYSKDFSSSAVNEVVVA